MLLNQLELRRFLLVSPSSDVCMLHQDRLFLLDYVLSRICSRGTFCWNIELML